MIFHTQIRMLSYSGVMQMHKIDAAKLRNNHCSCSELNERKYHTGGDVKIKHNTSAGNLNHINVTKEDQAIQNPYPQLPSANSKRMCSEWKMNIPYYEFTFR
eukprot:3907-Amorphochlora_amoeboformis.AAC.1